jgi:hypothetical protein
MEILLNSFCMKNSLLSDYRQLHFSKKSDPLKCIEYQDISISIKSTQYSIVLDGAIIRQILSPGKCKTSVGYAFTVFFAIYFSLICKGILWLDFYFGISTGITVWRLLLGWRIVKASETGGSNIIFGKISCAHVRTRQNYSRSLRIYTVKQCRHMVPLWFQPSLFLMKVCYHLACTARQILKLYCICHMRPSKDATKEMVRYRRHCNR